MTSDADGDVAEKPKVFRYRTIYVTREVRDELFRVSAELQLMARKSVSMGRAIEVLIEHYDVTKNLP